MTHLVNKIKLLSSFSHEIKTLSIMGTLLLFFVMTDKRLFDRKGNHQNGASSASGGGSSITKDELSHDLTNELPDYDALNSQFVSTPIPNHIHTLPIAELDAKLDMELLHSPEFDFDNQQSKIDISKSLEFDCGSQQSKVDISRVATVLFCCIIAVLVMLSIADTLEKTLQPKQSTLEFTSNMLSKSKFEPTSNTLSIGLLAAAFFPVALIIFDRLAAENLLSILEKSQSSGWQEDSTYPLSPKYKINKEQIHSDRKIQSESKSESKVSCRWQESSIYPLRSGSYQRV
ncbi:MAG: hypothetical protein PG981_000050 [Wolbachia endosymbiont of Ctenocephalides orientis wCori]|nr:MAG: hypothetical protein PG981_000050 [Wolbachia endosymbiont of Ctenocephalides orientis wCori]